MATAVARLMGDLWSGTSRWLQPVRTRSESRGTDDLGRVYLVGAGCGDPDLLTQRAARLIQTAEVLVYDRLVSPDIVALAPRRCKRIYVGKKPGQHSLPQDRIGELLAYHALSGKRVVRLKGGDPFVFGRGGEEMLLLADQGIPVDICPGITAALGCAASTGIPLTHRGLSQGCLFLTGQDQFEALPLANLSADLETLTLVIYMGVRQLPVIVKALLEKGLPDSWPIAIIENGATPLERVLVSTLGTVRNDAARSGIQTPALLFIGKTVRLFRATIPEHSGTTTGPEDQTSSTPSLPVAPGW